jgi:hypothetical protein
MANWLPVTYKVDSANLQKREVLWEELSENMVWRKPSYPLVPYLPQPSAIPILICMNKLHAQWRQDFSSALAAYRELFVGKRQKILYQPEAKARGTLDNPDGQAMAIIIRETRNSEVRWGLLRGLPLVARVLFPLDHLDPHWKEESTVVTAKFGNYELFHSLSVDQMCSCEPPVKKQRKGRKKHR